MVLRAYNGGFRNQGQLIVEILLDIVFQLLSKSDLQMKNFDSYFKDKKLELDPANDDQNTESDPKQLEKLKL